MRNWFLNKRGGQALAELLIGVAIGGIILGSSAAIIRVIVQSSETVRKTRVATELGQELVDNVTVYAEANWSTLYNLSKGASNLYYINTGVSPFANASGSEEVTIDSTTYTRNYYVDNVTRSNSDDSISGSGTNDPSTQKVTVTVTWDTNGSLTLVEYLARHRNFVFKQSDWSGGAGNTSVLTKESNVFTESSGVNASTTGQLKLTGY